MRMNEAEPVVKKKDLAKVAAAILAEEGYTKAVRDSKHVFHVTDNDGNRADFVVKKATRPVRLTSDDAEAVIDALIIAMREALKQGFKIYLHEFGTIKLIYRKERSNIHPVTKKRVVVPAHYYPRLIPGDAVRLAVKLYEQSLSEGYTPDELEKVYEGFDEDIDISIDDVDEDGLEEEDDGAAGEEVELDSED